MTTYDRIAHLVGAACLGVLGLSASPQIYQHLPWWLIAVASVVGFAVQTSTNPAFRPTQAPPAAPLALVVALATALALPSCKTPSAGADGGGVVVSTLIDCGVQAIHDVAIKLLDDVASALISDKWQEDLGALAATYGIEAVTCAVQEIGSQASHNFQASGDKLEAAKAERARLWLAAHPVKA